MNGKHKRPGVSLTGNNAEMCGRCRVNTLKYVLLPERRGIMIGVLESRERPEQSMSRPRVSQCDLMFKVVNANKDDYTVCMLRCRQCACNISE